MLGKRPLYRWEKGLKSSCLRTGGRSLEVTDRKVAGLGSGLSFSHASGVSFSRANLCLLKSPCFLDTWMFASVNLQYLLAKEEKQDMSTKAAEEPEVKNSANTTSEEVATPKTEENLVFSMNGVCPAADDESSGASTTTTEESNISTPVAEESASEATEPTAEESSKSADQEDSGDQDAEEKPEIKLETAPADFRFPTTNQSRHCFTRYIEYHRCVAAKGEGAPECDKFAKYYRSLCPGEWVDRWNEQRENGTFPGPL
ncbi:hypothetical protein RHSIM_Rhsim06G0078300 [Rhododendron simsii]|uniref:Cytochrome c oxidase subunit 6b-1 n=1 Tax=Rhododendron simsii TaxID=118357 RepID=A0A834GSC3_RHOSS|nr:hypothetical protein RHSIM_Rhsim06G0078300 [Rhododendron simsii]